MINSSCFETLVDTTPVAVIRHRDRAEPSRLAHVVLRLWCLKEIVELEPPEAIAHSVEEMREILIEKPSASDGDS